MPPTAAVLQGRFEVLRELDRTTWVVRDRAEPGRELHLRLVPPAHDDPGGGLLEEELTRLTGIVHPTLAAVHELGRSAEGELWFTQDRVEGESFYSWALQHPPERVAAVAAQALELMGHLHQRGLVLGGRRPWRLMVADPPDGAPLLRIVDVGGLCEEYARWDAPGQHAALLAPERRLGGRVDRRANLYELGVVLYETLASSAASGYLLPGREDAHRLPPLGEVSPQLPLPLAAFVMHLLRPVPDERPGSAEEALELLRQAVEATDGGVAGARPPAVRRPTPLVGRDEALLDLLAWTRPLMGSRAAQVRAAEDDPSLVLIAGPAGSGRRRLLEELTYRLDAEGARVQRARLGGVGAGGGLSCLLRAALQPDPARRLESRTPTCRWVVSQLLPDLSLEVSGPHPEPLEDPRAERLRLLDALTEPLLEAARSRPLLLVLEELERATLLERDWLAHLARRAASARRARSSDGVAEPLLLLAVTGPERDPLAQLPGVLELPCPPLPPEEAHRLALLRAPEASRTQPPTTALLPGEVLTAVDRAALVAPSPSSAAQAERLRLVLALAGAPCPLPVLAQASQLESDQLRPVLAELVALGQVRACPGWRYELPDAAAEQAVKEASDPELRAALAGALARALGALESSEATDPLTLHRLVLQADLLADATAADLRAAEALVQLGPPAAAHLEAMGEHPRAARIYAALAGSAPGEAAWELHRAEALVRCGAEEAGLASAEAARSSHLPGALRSSAWRLHAVALRNAGQLDAGAQALDDALEALPAPEGETAQLERARLLALSAELHLALGELELAAERAAAAEAALKEAGAAAPSSGSVRAGLLATHGRLAGLQGEPERAEQLIRAGLALTERQDAPRDSARLFQLLGSLALERGDFAQAGQHWQASLDRYLIIQDRVGEASARSSLAMSAARRGALQEAREELERALRTREELGDLPGQAASLHNLGYVYMSAGALQEAAAAYRRCLILRNRLGDRYRAASASSNLGMVLLDLGQARDARAHLEQALQAREQLGDVRGQAASLAGLAELARREGELGRAVELATRAQELREEVGEVEDAIDSLLLVARLHQSCGGLSRALRAAKRAASWAREQRLFLLEGQSRLLLGEVLAQDGDPVKARHELERTRRVADTVGDARTARAATLELARLQLQAGAPDDARARLDSRPVPRPGQLRPLEGAAPPDRYGVLRARERLLRASIELAREQGSVATAARCAEEALETARRAGLRAVEWRALLHLAAIAELRGSAELAAEQFAAARALLEQLYQSVPEDQRPDWLEADPARAATLQGESPGAVLPIRARPDPKSDVAEVPAVPRRSPRPEPARKSRPASPAPAAVPGAAEVARDDLHALTRLNRTIVDEPDVRRAYQELVTAAARLLGAERVFLSVFGDDPDACSLLAAHGLEDLTHPRERFARRCAFKAAETGQLVLSADVKAEPTTRARARVLGLGLRSVLAAPVRTPDGQRGALAVDHPFQSGRFGPREVELLEALADQCALALGRAALEAALHRREGLAPGPAQRAFLAERAGRDRPGGADLLQLSPPGGPRVAARSPALRRALEALGRLAREGGVLLLEGPAGVGKTALTRAAQAAASSDPWLRVDLPALELEGDDPAPLAGGPAGSDLAPPAGTLVWERLDEATPPVLRLALNTLEAWLSSPRVPEGALRVLITARDLAAARGIAPQLEPLLAQLQPGRVVLPPLDERPEDKAPLLEALLSAWEGSPPLLSGPVRTALERRCYPGNAREMQALLRAASARARGRALRLEDLPPERRAEPISLTEALAGHERALLQRALRAHGEDLTAAAESLGLSRRAFERRLAALGLSG